MEDVTYELVLTIRARSGGAVSAPLLPELIVRTEDSLLPILIGVNLMYREQEVLSSLGADDVIALADKVEKDVASKKYKWELHRSMK